MKFNDPLPPSMTEEKRRTFVEALAAPSQMERISTAALQGLLTSHHLLLDPTLAAKHCVEYARALIAELDAQNSGKG